jgi:flavin-dependent dehydrogenase
MSRFDYDVVTVGGGLGGSALARVLAARGVRVLVLEREQRFADRVRGEVLAPWGVAEMRALQLDELLRSAGAHDLPWFNLFYLGAQVARRDLIATTPQGLPWQAFYHPAMQEQLIGAAQAAGAEVNRGAGGPR